MLWNPVDDHFILYYNDNDNESIAYYVKIEMLHDI